MDGLPAADVYRSPNGTTWTFAATLTARGGFTPDLMNSGSPGAVLAGQSGGTLTAFLSPDGASWHRVPAFGRAAAETISGVAVTGTGAVIAAGTSSILSGGSQRLVTIAGPGGGPGSIRSVSLAAIPGAVQPELAVNAVAAQGSAQVTVGSANGFPAAWVSADGGRTWHRGAGTTPAVLTRPGLEQLTSVTHGGAGWLAVGDVTGAAPVHPVVIGSADGSLWSAADGEAAFAGSGLVSEQAAAGPGGYVIVGSRLLTQTAGYRMVSSRTIAAAWWSARLAAFGRRVRRGAGRRG